jgi:hypothetical protein
MSRTKRCVLVVTLLVLALSVTGGALAGPSREDPASLGLLTHEINFQGRLTTPDGAPVADGDYSLTFKLYNVPAAGAALATDTNSVHTDDGLFNTSLSFGAALIQFNGQELYVGVTLSGESEMTPRIAVRPVPYALGLRPGARMETAAIGSAYGSALFNASNSAMTAGYAAIYGASGFSGIVPGSPVGVRGDASTGYGVAGTSDTGSGVFGASNSGFGVSGSSSTGDALRGYSTAGASVYAIGTGKIKSTAKSYVWISGNAFVKDEWDDATRWNMYENGSARIWLGSGSGTLRVYYPITLPSVLYGQPVKLTKLTVYYVCYNASKAFITYTDLHKFADADSATLVAGDATDYTSGTATSYSLNLTTNNVLSADQGGLGLYISLQCTDNTSYVQIGGIRLELEHD